MTSGEVAAPGEPTRSTPARVIWLLDVDGVLNARRPGWTGEPPRTGFATAGGRDYLITWSPALIGCIRDLYETGLVEIWWCTTWCEDADQIEALLGLPAFRRVWTEPVNRELAALVKGEAAQAVIDQGHYLVWTDDSAIPESGPDREALERDGRCLLIAPPFSCGLQPTDLHRIEEFIRSVVGAGSDGRVEG